MRERPDLTAVSDDQLLSGLFEVLKKTRDDETDLVAHIAEVDARELYAREASPSMFAWCTQVLHLSEAEAYLRIGAARASRRHPVLLAMLADGQLHLSGIERLAPHLTEENRDVVLKRAVHKTKRQIEELVAELAPRPAAAAKLRKLPARRGVEAGLRPDGAAVPEGAPAAGSGRKGASLLRPDGVGVPGGGPALDGVLSPSGELRLDGVAASAHQPDGAPGFEAELRRDGAAALRASRAKPTRAPEAIAPDRYRLQFDLDGALRDKLERLQALVRHEVPDGDLGQVIEVAVSRELERLEAKRFGKTRKPRKRMAETDTTSRSRHIPAAVRRFVEKRDGGRCTYRDKHGRRCTKRHDLEFHHILPFAVGGDHSPEGIALMCRTHNQLLAEEEFGKEKMARHRRRGRSDAKAVEVASEGTGASGLRARWRSPG